MSVSRIICILSLLLIQGCTSLQSYHPLPEHLENQVEVPGFGAIRAWGDIPSRALKESAVSSIQQEAAFHHGKLQTEVNALALSGGGQDGAFGAGLMCGWTKHGTRPTFKLITGISTGALMAPFIFLGPAYDDRLKTAYTTISDKDVYKQYSILSIVLSLANIAPLTSATDNTSLNKLVNKLIDAEVLKQIAIEHRKGRRLLIGTAQMNAERLVIWDMGAIAASNTPGALALFRKVMIASTSIPATFPPQFIKVKAAGKEYDEMHSDGGVEVQVMLFENAIIPFAREGDMLRGQKRIRRLYIIRNDSMHPNWEDVKPEIKTIAVRAINTLIKSTGIGDLFRLYTYAKRDQMEYNLAYIPKEFNEKSKSPFDKEYMNKLFSLGYKMGLAGYQWHHYPPEFRTSDL